MAFNNIRPGQGFLKSQRWKIGRAQVVALMWASSWIDEVMTYLWCRAYRREVLLAHGVGHLQGYLCAGVLTWVCDSCRTGTGTPGDCFTVIVVAACNRKPLCWCLNRHRSLVLFQDTTLLCALSPAAVLYFM